MDAPAGADAGGRARLYLITPPRIDGPAAFARVLDRALAAGDVACLQLRLKEVDEKDWAPAAEALMPVCHAHDVAFIVNDRPDLAAAFGADGVHVGQEDASYQEAREILGEDAIVGVTCHDSRHLAMVAADAGADYVAFGAFFPTATKAPKSRAKPELLVWWNEIAVVPSVAIGGITVENCRPLVDAGADFLAVVSGVWNNPDGPEAAVRAFNDIFDAARG